LGHGYLDTPVIEIESFHALLPLQERRQYMDNIFLFRLVNGFLDCPSLLSDIDFTVLRGTRSKSLFQRRCLPRNDSLNHGVSRLLRLGSE
ncbi:hypothetical protein J6590_107153, partial [Homalodisca vitripennis]